MADLPKLPEKAMKAVEIDGQLVEVYGYTSDQMLAFQRETVEACAKVCEVEAEKWQTKGLLGYVAVLIDDAAKAIRSMK